MIEHPLTFYSYRTTRNEFIDIVFQKQEISPKKVSILELPQSKEGYIDLFWDINTYDDKNNRQDYLPILITMKQEEIRDFLAWTSTYFPGLTPLTSYIHVSDIQMVSSINTKGNEYYRDNLWNALIGMILSEVYVSDSMTNNAFSPDLYKCEMTFSYILARALLCGYSIESLATLYEEWKASLQFADIKFSGLPFSCYLAILDFISDSFDVSKSLFTDYKTKNNDTDFNYKYINKHLDSLFKSYNEFSNFQNITKEDRYSTMNKIYQQSFDTLGDAQGNEVILAYLVNMISPGTLQHLDFFHGKRVEKNIWLWYGALAGLTEQTKIRDIYNYVGRRLYRDMTAKINFIETPICDISSYEARVIFDSSDDIVQLFKRRIIKMQLALGIDIDLVFPSNPQVNSLKSTEESDESDPKKIITNMIKELYTLNSLIPKKIATKTTKQSNFKSKRKKQNNLFDNKDI